MHWVNEDSRFTVKCCFAALDADLTETLNIQEWKSKKKTSRRRMKALPYQGDQVTDI